MPAALPPGPRQPKTIQTIGWWSRPIPFLERCRARYGKRFTIRLLATPPFVMLSDPEEIKQVFTAPPEVLHPGEGARILEPIVGRHSVILLDEGEHLEQRKLILGAFHGERMAAAEGSDGGGRAPPRSSAGRAASRSPLHPRLQALTLEVILRAVFGLERGGAARAPAPAADGDPRVRLQPRLAAAPAATTARRARPLAASSTSSAGRPTRSSASLIEERRASGAAGDDVLTMLLEARHEDGTEMSREEIRDELMTLLVAGHETTASELAWCFARLSHEPRVLARLVGGDRCGRGRGVPDRDRAGDPAQAPGAAECGAALRRPRRSRSGGWSYPAGVCLVPNAYLVHHDPEIYPDPYSFRPERFLDASPGTYSWIPFGGGRRRCIGANFALLEMRIVLRTVLAANRLIAAGDATEVARRRAITISPAQGAEAVLERRPVAA